MMFLELDLQGYVLGNPKTDTFIDTNSRISFAYHLTLIPKELYEVSWWRSFYCLFLLHKLVWVHRPLSTSISAIEANMYTLFPFPCSASWCYCLCVILCHSRPHTKAAMETLWMWIQAMNHVSRLFKPLKRLANFSLHLVSSSLLSFGMDSQWPFNNAVDPWD